MLAPSTFTRMSSDIGDLIEQHHPLRKVRHCASKDESRIGVRLHSVDHEIPASCRRTRVGGRADQDPLR
jgi:hypothetical protein